MNGADARAALREAVCRAFVLMRHAVSEEPDGPSQHVAYVGFPGSTVLKVARWRDGEWRDHRGQPFAETPDRWFSVEPRARVDG